MSGSNSGADNPVNRDINITESLRQFRSGVPRYIHAALAQRLSIIEEMYSDMWARFNQAAIDVRATGVV